MSRAIRIHRFGGPDVLTLEHFERDRAPGRGEVRLRVEAAGVGPWDAWIREGKSTKVDADALPLTLGADIAGIVEEVGEDVFVFGPGDAVFGVANGSFTSGYASSATAEASRLALKPAALAFEEAAALPVIGVTALDMLAHIRECDAIAPVVVLGASGSVGEALLQLARLRRLDVVAYGSRDETPRLLSLGARRVVEGRAQLVEACRTAGVVLDTVGGELQREALRSLGHGGLVVSIVEPPQPQAEGRGDVRGAFFIVDVRSDRLEGLAGAVDLSLMKPRIGRVLPLEQARLAHEMLDGTRPRPRGKLVLAP